MSYGEFRVGRWACRWVPKSGPLPFEMIIGRLKREPPLRSPEAAPTGGSPALAVGGNTAESQLTTALIDMSRCGYLQNTSPWTWQGVARRLLEKADAA